MSIPAPAPPSVTSLPLPDPEAYPGEPREYAMALMQRKGEIEKAIDALNDVLASHGSTASTSLFDPEGFPRADIDIYSIRHARSSLIYLNNDLRAVNDLLPAALASALTAPSDSFGNALRRATEQRASQKAHGSSQTNGHGPAAARGGTDDMPEVWPERAIARVNTVETMSPAAEAGMRPGDVIYAFSDVTAGASGGLQAIGQLVQRSEGVTLTLLVLRDGERIRLRLTPRTGWGGRGSLGCHILPA